MSWLAVGALVVVCIVFCPRSDRTQRCPAISSSLSNGNVQCHGFQNGCSCTFSCLPGYRLDGRDRITCRGTQWDDVVPHCNKIICPSLPDKPRDLQDSCTNNYYYQSTCSFSCTKPGYSTCSNDNNCCPLNKICTYSSQWIGSYPLCYDRERPVFKECPRSREVIATEGAYGAIVTWDHPLVTDNSDETITPVIVCGFSPGSTFPEGSTSVKYEARDSAGNIGGCAFSITVRVRKCKALVPQSNQQIECSMGSVVGSVCSFACSPGYFLSGMDHLTCETIRGRENGENPIEKRSNVIIQWSSNPPSCLGVTCPAIILPPNGQFVSGCSSVNYGSRCAVACKTGYELVGTSTIQCTASNEAVGNWEGQFSCSRITCTQPYFPPQGVISNPDICDMSIKATPGIVCEYACNTGYILVGPTSLTCNNQGQWSQQFPRCQVVKCDCSEQHAPTNGRRTGCNTPLVDYGTTIIQECNYGFMPTIPNYVTCGDGGHGTGEWSDTVLTCEAIQCEPPEVSSNSRIVNCLTGQPRVLNTNPDLYHQYGSLCLFACDQGYVSSGGSTRRTCMLSGQWDGSPLVCVDNQIPELTCPSSRTFYAGRGQSFVDVNYAEWEPVQALDIGISVNASLTSIDNQQVTGTKKSRFGEGNHFLIYEASDTSGNTATCYMLILVRVTRCYPVPLPLNSQSELASGQGSCLQRPVYGSQCVLRCNDGYHLTNNAPNVSRVCERLSEIDSVGYWSGSYQSCQANTCSVPILVNGYISGCADVVPFQHTCQFRCNYGFESSDGRGNVVHRTCLKNGTWSGQDFQCQAIKCPSVSSVSQGGVQPPSCIDENALLKQSNTCSFYCNNGFNRYGPQSIYCTGWGYWSDSRSPTCEDVQRPVFDESCPIIVNEDAPTLQRTKSVMFNEPTATDNAGPPQIRRIAEDAPGASFSEGQTRIIYLAEDTAGNSARCDVIIDVRVRRCHSLPAPSGGKITCTDGVIYGSTCTFTCNPGYQPQGSVSRTCEVDSTTSTTYWSGTVTQCNVITCPAIASGTNVIRLGCLTPPTASTYGTVCHWYCPPGYSAVGTPMSQCQMDGTWSSNDFSCQEMLCSALDLPPDMNVYPFSCRTDSSSTEQSCVISCPRAGYRIYPYAAEEVQCRSSGLWSRNVNNIQCEDFERPSFTTCPRTEIIYAERNQLSAIVTWDVAAEDNSGEVPSISCDLDQGVYKAEGNYYVICTALDAAGNEAFCAFLVSVRVHRCLYLRPPLFGITHTQYGQCSNHYGSQCQTTCTSGYILRGNSIASCERDDITQQMYWDQGGDPPTCQHPTCSPLPDLISGSYGGITPLSCKSSTSRPTPGMTCELYCQHGFNLQNISISRITCQSDGTWDTNINELSPYCQDTTKPTLLSCPGTQHILLDETTSLAKATFEIPRASDNSREPLTVMTSPIDITSPYYFARETLVNYTFCDAANLCVSCIFEISIIVNKPPTVSICPPDISITGSFANNIIWQRPEFRHPITNAIVPSICSRGPPANFTRGRSTVQCMAYLPKSTETAVCSFTVTVEPAACEPLHVPSNGAMLCDTSFYGEFCYQFCSAGYDVPNQVSHFFQSGVPYICQEAIWSINLIEVTADNQVPDCERSISPIRFYLPGEIYYYSNGDCTDPAVITALKVAFLTLISESMYATDYCTNAQECNVTDINIMCGPTDTSRRRRDTGKGIFTVGAKLEDQLKEQLPFKNATKYQELVKHANETIHQWMDEGRIPKVEEHEYHLPWDNNPTSDSRNQHFKKLIKRETNNNITISFTVARTFNPDTNADPVDESWDSVDDFEYLMGSLYTLALSGNLVPVVSGVMLTSRVDDGYPMYYWPVQPDCGPGYGEAATSLLCSPCFRGTFSANGECQACSIGTYQDEKGQSSCKLCPTGKSTSRIGSQSIDSCQDSCLPGHISDTGFAPCAVCPRGYYQPSSSAIECIVCPNGESTEQVGAKSLFDCRAFCSSGSSSSTGLSPCTLCPRHHYQPTLGQTECIQCPDSKITIQPGADSQDLCIENTLCDSLPCQNGGSCHRSSNALDTPYVCECVTGYSGDHCEFVINPCEDNPCVNGVCYQYLNTFLCVCPKGYQGLDCSNDTNECLSQPCDNDARCMNTPGSFICTCKEGFTGTFCETDINECSSNPCQNDGTCDDNIGFYECECSGGYTGPNCNDDVNECSSDPCSHGGSCNNHPGTFSCSCSVGYTGQLCEIDIDLCADDPCYSGATCIDLETTYKCMCPPDKTGGKCEMQINPCTSSPCANQGTCVVEENQQGRGISVVVIIFRCDCLPGFEGETCEININECDSNPCSNDGTCEDHVNYYLCICPEGYEGTNCETPSNPCDSGPCLNGGTCSQENQDFTCACPKGTTGDKCEIKVPICTRNTCHNGGICSSDTETNELLCACPPGYTGSICNINIDECHSSPCENEGTCYDGINGFTCTCALGFTDDTCITNIDECEGVVCQNDGTCEDKVDGYECVCAEGFKGPHCEIDIDDCQENICRNGDCEDRVNGYECSCHAGFIGRNCDEDLDECSSNPCGNGATCTDGINSFECACSLGWQGDVCDVSVDDCISNPCRYSATCTDAHNGYVCTCAPGYTGPLCSTNINECLSNPCQRGATCLDRVNGFQCQCPRGFKGRSCQIDEGPCQPNPCYHGGQCSPQNNVFTCSCIEGYQGARCENRIIDPCSNHTCQNGARCEDQVIGYICHCPLGYSGQYCEQTDNVCNTFPCSNGGTCQPPNNNGDNIFCICPSGFTGVACEFNINDCLPNPCLHGGTCKDGLNQFTCYCNAGYSGFDCSENINECELNECQNGASCTDIVDGYVCVCPHGFEGELCQYANNDFDLVIENRDQSVELLNPFDDTISAFTLAFWIKASSEEGNVLSYHQLSNDGNISTTDFAINNPQDLIVDIKGYQIIGGINLNDDQWHHLTIVWDGISGRAQMYHRGIFSGSGKSNLLVGSMAGQGLFVIGNNTNTASFNGSIGHVNMWQSVQDLAIIQENAAQCASSMTPGDIVAPSDFYTTKTTLMEGVMVQRPSMCDDYENCANNPCQSGGTCVEEIGRYTCLCPDGFTGTNCQTNFDDCIDNDCQNDFICIDEIASYRCLCLDHDYTGQYCETRRVCDPLPIDADSHIVANCTGDGSVVEKVCDLTCEEGYGMSLFTQGNQYRCGSATFYQWSKVDDVQLDSPFIPVCTDLSLPTIIEVEVSMNYTDVNCTSGGGQSDTKDTFRQTIGNKADKIPCAKEGSCQVDTPEIEGCEERYDGRRSKRAVPERSDLIAKIKIRRPIVNHGKQNDELEQATIDLEEAVTKLDDLTANGEMAVPINNVEYNVNLDSRMLASNFTCSVGSVQSREKALCVTCQGGTYFNEGICELCPSDTTSPPGAIDITQCLCK